MKSLIVVIALSAAFATSAMAENRLECKSRPNAFQSVTSVTMTVVDAYDATLSGTIFGGKAHFIRQITPVNVKISHESDTTIYENIEEGVLLRVDTRASMATFKNGGEEQALTMTCAQM